VDRYKSVVKRVATQKFNGDTKPVELASDSKFISTVGEVSLLTVKQYIENQKNK